MHPISLLCFERERERIVCLLFKYMPFAAFEQKKSMGSNDESARDLVIYLGAI